VKDIAPANRNEADIYCAQFSGERAAACHNESWPLSRDLIKTPEGAVAFCSYSSNPDFQQTCYSMVFSAITDFANYDQKTIAAFCEKLPRNRAAQCFARAASRFIESSQTLGREAVSVCKEAESLGMGERCYSELLYFSTHNYHEGSRAFVAFCALLPEPWKQKCFAGEGDAVPILNDV
jgi:hypothetical protein